MFEVRVVLPDGEEVTAQGSSLKKAEQLAARKALAVLEDKEEA
jgi:dsRNA-specific ribonuclease